MKKLPLHLQIILGLLVGIIWAAIAIWLKEGIGAGMSEFTLNFIAPFGDIFINLLKLIAVPLVLFSIIHGISGLKDSNSLGRLGVKTLGMYLGTTLTAVAVGLLLVNIFQPGVGLNEDTLVVNRMSYELWANDNGIELADEKSYLTNEKYVEYMDEASAKNLKEMSDEFVAEKQEMAMSQKDSRPLDFLVQMVPSNIFLSFNDSLMLQVIFFAIFFGITIVSLPKEKTTVLVSFIEGGNNVFIRMVDLVMLYAPFFVFALMAGKLTEMANGDLRALADLLVAVLKYCGVVILGLAFMVFLFYPTLVRSFVKGMTFKKFLKAISPAQFLAFSTSSSAATLPITMECVNQNLKVKEEVSSFVLPIGATVNMDGTSLYQAVAVVFLAQIHGIDLSLVQQLTIVLTATLASIGSAAVPSAGLIMLIIVLQSVGLNPAWIGIILPVDRILDMCRTVVNVTGDASVSTIVASSENMMEE